MKHILVTGATGKVGSHFVPRLLQRENVVRILVRRAEQAEPLRKLGAEVVIGDLNRPDSVVEAVSGIDTVVHLAAFFRGATDEELVRTTNEESTLALAQASIKAGVERFVFTSTSLVYGPGRGRPAREEDEPQPRFTYPITKRAAEQALLALHRTEGLGLRILRLPFVYGEGDPHISELLPRFSTYNPAQRFHMGHHADVGQALIRAIQTPGIDGRIYNVADDAPITIYELLNLHHQPAPTDFPALNDPWEGIVETLKIRDELGYSPIYPSFYSAWDAGAL
jgi:nucleoside-diphosphate-sugar epimerase